MVYINPIEILGLGDKEVNEIDSDVIKKAKRRLFAEIELSDDDFYQLNGQKLTKSDCERAIDELENKDKIEFYSHLVTNIPLNQFLISGESNLLLKFKHESIYQLPEFVDFISPMFSTQIDRVLVKSFQKSDLALFSAALQKEHLIAKSDLNKAFKSLSNEIQHRISDTEALTEQIKEETSEYTDDSIEDVVKVVKSRFPDEFLNKLPQFFQSQINKIASSINYLQLNIWNEFNTTSVSLLLLEHLLRLNIESVSKPTFEKNYNIVKKKHEQRLEQEKNEPFVKEWATLLLTFKRWLDEFKTEDKWSPVTFLECVHSEFEKRVFSDGTIDYNYAITPRAGHTSDPEAIKRHYDKIEKEKARQRELGESKERLIWLNELPEFANEIRNQFALTLRTASIFVWNEHNDIKHSLELIELALSIKLTEEIRDSISNDQEELLKLEDKYKGVLICHFCETNPPEKGCEFETTIYKETSRSYFPRRSVQYTYSEVSIPRCKNCKEIHGKGSGTYYLAFFGVIVLGVVIGAATDGEHFIIGGIIGAVVGWILGKVLEGQQVEKGGVKGTSESTLSEHPLLSDRVNDGWTFSQPTA